MTINAREKLVELLTEFYGSDPMYYGVDALAIAEHLIGNGVTPVVRCKDCKWLYDEMDDYCCRSHRGLVRICENSFCSYGERKENK